MKLLYPVALAALTLGGLAVAQTSGVQLTQAEHVMWEHLTQRMASTTPAQILRLNDGRAYTGWLLGATQNMVRWAAPLGADGRLVAEFDRALVQRIEKLPEPPPNVNYCDVSFQLEFPSLRMLRRPPYTMLTDEPPMCAERYLKALQILEADFRRRFGVLNDGLGLPDHVQVLLFSDEDAFRDYQRKVMGRHANVPGFYISRQQRLVLFDQRHASGLGEFLEHLDFQCGKADVRARTEEAAAQIRLQYLSQATALLHQAELGNQRLLRHEGAHQLFHASGVLAEETTSGWLDEGLAVWCEQTDLGALNFSCAEMVQSSLGRWRWFTLAELVNRREPGGHGFCDTTWHRDLAYAEAWSLVRLLMRPRYQAQFFAYLRYLRNLDAAADVSRTPPLDLLCRFLAMTPKELEARWRASIERLPLDPQ